MSRSHNRTISEEALMTDSPRMHVYNHMPASESMPYVYNEMPQPVPMHVYNDKSTPVMIHSSRPSGYLLASVTLTPIMCISFLVLAWYTHIHPLGLSAFDPTFDVLLSSLSTNAVVIWNALAMLPVHVVVVSITAGEWLMLLEKGEKKFQQICRVSSLDISFWQKIKAIAHRQTTLAYAASTLTMALALLSTIVAPSAFALSLGYVPVFQNGVVPIPSLTEGGIDLRSNAVEWYQGQQDSVNMALFYRTEPLTDISMEYLIPLDVSFTLTPNVQAVYDTDVVSFQQTCIHPQAYDPSASGHDVIFAGVSLTTPLNIGPPDSITLQQDGISDGTHSGQSMWIINFGTSFTNFQDATPVINVNGSSIAAILCTPNYSVQRATISYDGVYPLGVNVQPRAKLLGNIDLASLSDILSYGLGGFANLTSAQGFSATPKEIVFAFTGGVNSSNPLLPLDQIATGLTTIAKKSSFPYFAKLSGPTKPTVGSWSTIGLGTRTSPLQLVVLTIVYGLVIIMAVTAVLCKWYGREPMTVDNVLKYSDALTTEAVSMFADDARVELAERNGRKVLMVKNALL